MNGAEQNPAIAVLSQDDGAIESAINDLDQKIATWVDAMDKASAALAQVALAEPAIRAESDSSSSAEASHSAPGAESKPVEVAPKPEGCAEAPLDKSEAPAEPVSGIVTLPGSKKSKKPKLKASPRKGAAKDDSKPVDESPKAPVIPEKTKEELDAEDEALLAQLDPKVAKSIRIKRRLSRGKKSVREMINELNK